MDEKKWLVYSPADGSVTFQSTESAYRFSSVLIATFTRIHDPQNLRNRDGKTDDIRTINGMYHNIMCNAVSSQVSIFTNSLYSIHDLRKPKLPISNFGISSFLFFFLPLIFPTLSLHYLKLYFTVLHFPTLLYTFLILSYTVLTLSHCLHTFLYYPILSFTFLLFLTLPYFISHSFSQPCKSVLCVLFTVTPHPYSAFAKILLSQLY